MYRAGVTGRGAACSTRRVEIRPDSFATPDFIALLRRHRIGLVVADTVAWPILMDVTSDFVYCRLHGSVELYASGYDDAALDRWADHISAWARGYENRRGKRASARPPAKRASRDVYINFDNDKKVRAPFDAHSWIAKVRQRLER